VKRLGVAVVLLSVGLWLLPLSARALEVGDKAPDFLLHSTVGETVRLSDYTYTYCMTLRNFFGGKHLRVRWW
jgi:hypothetical protein